MNHDAKHEQFARAAAICVNLALDGVERDIRHELEKADSGSAERMRRILNKLQKRRITEEMIVSAASA